jgi:hypothetical protein
MCASFAGFALFPTCEAKKPDNPTTNLLAVGTRFLELNRSLKSPIMADRLALSIESRTSLEERFSVSTL